MVKKVLLYFSLSLLFLQGQNGIISGFVTDSSSGEALIGANVILIESGQGMATETNGYYIIQNVLGGTHTLLVSYVGFETCRSSVSISTDESIKVDVFCFITPVRFNKDFLRGNKFL